MKRNMMTRRSEALAEAAETLGPIGPRVHLPRAAKDYATSPYTVKQKLYMDESSTSDTSITAQPSVTASNSSKPTGVSKKKKNAKARPKRKPKPRAPKEPTYHCMFCASSKKLASFPIADDFPPQCHGCAIGNPYGDTDRDVPLDGNMVCLACSRKTISMTINDNYNVGAHCWICHRAWDISALRPFTSMSDIVRFEERITNRHLESDPLFRWCAHDKCVSGQFFDEDSIKDGPRVCCGQCEGVNCFDCRVPWHEGLTCEEFRKPDVMTTSPGLASAATLQAMRQNITKRCPTCNAAIEKTFGCSHMTCVSCGNHYSWDQAAGV